MFMCKKSNPVTVISVVTQDFAVICIFQFDICFCSGFLHVFFPLLYLHLSDISNLSDLT